MKKIASVLGAAIMLATAIVPAGATTRDQPSASAGVHQMAYANWLVRENGELVMYFAAGMNRAPEALNYSVGVVGRAPCRYLERNGRKYLRCNGRARGHELLPGDFVVDPALNTATMSMEAKGDVHTIDWTGRGDLAEPYWHQHSGPGFNAMAMVMAWRRANATGSVFGRDLPRGRGVMFEEVLADAWLLAPTTNSRMRIIEDVLEVRATFPLR